jgi:membrane-associated phospholipid phosphatase
MAERRPETPIVRSAEQALAATEHVLDPRPSAEAVPPTGTVPAVVAVRRARTASTVAMASLVGFLGILVAVRAGRSQAFDLAVTLRVQARRHPFVAQLMTAASWPGFPPQSRLIAPAVMIGLWAGRLRLEALALAAGWGSALLSTIIKALMRRPRPLADGRLRVVTAPLGGSSFPSGHVLTYVGLYGTLTYLAATLIRPARWRTAVVGGLLALLAAVGPSRVHQGHHWPTDVTASYLLGTAYVIGVTSLYRRIKARRAGLRP